MVTDNFFRAQLAQMIDLREPLAVFVNHVPWAQIKARLAPAFVCQNLAGHAIPGLDLLGAKLEIAGARLSAAMLFLNHAFNLGHAELVVFGSGRGSWKSNLPRDATPIIRFRKAIGGAGGGGCSRHLSIRPCR